MKNNVFHFVFCEERHQPQDKSEPFVYEMIRTNIPCLFVTNVPTFTIFLNKFPKDQEITVWVHHQANKHDEDKFKRYLGESTGAEIIDTFPNIKFKYITRAPNHPSKSSDKNKTEIISMDEIFAEIKNQANFQKISDFVNLEKLANQDFKNNHPLAQPNITIKTNYGVVSSGNENSISNKVSIKEKKEYLSRELKNAKVEQKDVDEILEIISTEEPDINEGKFGKKTNEWIQKMIGKSLDGSWQVSVGAAAGILTELLKGFWGM